MKLTCEAPYRGIYLQYEIGGYIRENQNRKSKNQNRKSKKSKIENRKLKIENRKSKIENR